MSSEMTNSSILTSDLASHNIDTAELVFQAFGKSWDSFFKFNNDHLIPFSRPSSIGNNLFKLVAEKSTLSNNCILEIIVSTGNFKLFDYFLNLTKRESLLVFGLDQQEPKRILTTPKSIPILTFVATNQVERLESFISRLKPLPKAMVIASVCIKYGKLDIINRICPKDVMNNSIDELFNVSLGSSQLPMLCLLLENLASQPTSFLHLIGMAGIGKACSFGRGEMVRYLVKIQDDKGWDSKPADDHSIWNNIKFIALDKQHINILVALQSKLPKSLIDAFKISNLPLLRGFISTITKKK
ncbi:hypothetical protein DFA_07792 [Cavenderia fasciculata]|uniref:Uncharacterized protein n=1 Tax=Cavenderia fasciculata TaxID=261658 RepID=F4Q3E5_CACFS|nr:uncharacterized protein DFA_07792 [Cavenderia fasciculata]EGG16814.1 hypothetical protein DFA_07792 [Cavenderia fasciculata]|eukprot:XP_004355288.1 hypothetical protein DFA_07792 [Cavenderia fasciculata]